MARKSGSRFFGTDVRGIRTRSLDDVENGYNLDGCEISNPGKENYTFKSIMRANTLNARAQLTL